MHKALEILNLYHTHGEDIMFVPFKKYYVMEAISELKEAMKPKTCYGCKTLPFVLTELAKKNGGKCGTCKRYVKDNFEEELKKAYIGGSNDAWKARKEKE